MVVLDPFFTDQLIKQVPTPEAAWGVFVPVLLLVDFFKSWLLIGQYDLVSTFKAQCHNVGALTTGVFGPPLFANLSESWGP